MWNATYTKSYIGAICRIFPYLSKDKLGFPMEKAL
jgi:hypothetical protein